MAMLRTQWIALDLIVQRKEKRQSESNAKPEFLRECHWCNQHLEPAVQPEVLGAEGSAGTQREPGHSLAKAPSHPGLQTDPGKGPQSATAPQSAPWESIPCLLLYPEFVTHSPSIYNGSISPRPSPESPREQAAHPRHDIFSTASPLTSAHHFSLHKIQMVYSCWPPLP